MDKYTVDLDKVLNDFEYSEYSLENAKVNKNIHTEIPNTPISTNHCTKNDISVKHSINNVFHSLNEYLSSDITPRNIEKVSNTFKPIEIPDEIQASSFSAESPVIVPQEVLPQIKESFLQNFDESQVMVKENENVEKCSSILENVESKNFSDTCAINSDADILQEETNSVVVDSAATHNVDNKCLLVEMPENQISLIPSNNLGVEDLIKIVPDSKDEPCEEILVDLSYKSSCDDSTNVKIDEVDIKQNDILEDKSTENEEMSSENIIILQEDEYPKANGIEDSSEKETINSISNKKSIEDVRLMSLEDGNISSKIEKIGFDHDIELDEENIEQYFQELEKELGIEEDETIDKVNEKSATMNSVENDSLKLKIVEKKEIEETEKEVAESIESKGISSLEESNGKAVCEEKEGEQSTSTDTNENFIGSSSVQEELEENISDNSNTNSMEDQDQSVNLEEINKISENNETIMEDNLDGTKNQTEKSQESSKNSRPHILPLSEESQEIPRKIDLIGEPGSTPYNNLYSTKDFSKTITDAAGDQTDKRAISPSYSDVSTDSVSSSSTEETKEYKDAVSEVKNDEHLKETVQNNLVHTVETSKSDVTMNKDFKNNLKMSNVKTEDGPSTSQISLEESGPVPLDDSEMEGACAMNVMEEHFGENSAKEKENKIGESSNASGIDWLGKQAPLWIPDNEATSCLHCDMKFTVIKRRHHCRACGLVLCSKCCNLRYRLEYLNAEARVCMKCFEILDRDTNSNSGSEISQESSSPSRNPNSSQDNLGQPNPNNPLEYCSTIPPTQQVDAGAMAVPSVMVPVGVLKRKGSNKGRSNKSVMFCDGIRPGSDLTNLDTDFNYSENQKSEKHRKSPEKLALKTGRNLDMVDSDTKSFIPSDDRSLPPTVTIFKTDIKYSPCANNSSVVEMLKNETLTFALQSNVFVHVKIINMDCCVSRIAWCFSTEGLINVGQDELVVLLEYMENESLVPKDVFVHLNYLYLEAVKGISVKELGMTLHSSSPFLGSKNHVGFIYIRPTFQCLQNVIIPKEPYLIGILIHRWETPWAKLFPLRLLLRLGAEYKYYPSPIISTRDRDSVFVEIGHTIINLLADFRNFSYTLPQIRGLTIHMEDKNTTVNIPKNRYDQILKSLSNSSDHILAFAGNFSSIADSHLVCIQDTQSATNSYSTHAINICNQPRKVTGASFIVFNGALKSTSGLTAKSNIVEDGLMIQILPEHMLKVRDSLKNMKNHTIKCGCINEESDETVTIVWGEPDTSFNVGVVSPIDNKALAGIPSIRVHNGKDYTCNSGNRLIRWTEVFISQSGDEPSKNQESIDVSKISENISKATCQALVKYLDLLVSNSFYKIGLRTHIHVENVSYSAGSNNVKLPPIYMKSLDNELIPVLHRIASNNVTDQPIILELIFRILNI